MNLLNLASTMTNLSVTMMWIAAIGIMSAITILLRALPLLIRRSVLKTPWMSKLLR
jgi:branched-subunit amino acid transport protein